MMADEIAYNILLTKEEKRQKKQEIDRKREEDASTERAITNTIFCILWMPGILIVTYELLKILEWHAILIAHLATGMALDTCLQWVKEKGYNEFIEIVIYSIFGVLGGGVLCISTEISVYISACYIVSLGILTNLLGKIIRGE